MRYLKFVSSPLWLFVHTDHGCHLKLGFPQIPETKPEGDALNDEQTLKDLHRLLLETQVMEGKLICGNCGHQYTIKEGIANFLLPSHLGQSIALTTIFKQLANPRQSEFKIPKRLKKRKLNRHLSGPWCGK